MTQISDSLKVLIASCGFVGVGIIATTFTLWVMPKTPIVFYSTTIGGVILIAITVFYGGGEK